jgi:hypothetical protein
MLRLLEGRGVEAWEPSKKINLFLFPHPSPLRNKISRTSAINYTFVFALLCNIAYISVSPFL